MKKTNDMPIWVFLALSSIETRKGALILIGISVLFSIYCLPWSTFTDSQIWVGKVFLINGWSWFAMMVPITVWYWVSMKWVDSNGGWAVAREEEKG